jgi:hypothetical protein
MPSFMHLFYLFWPYLLLCKVIRETNHYATEADEVGNTIGGPNWKEFTVPELKAFMAVQIYMGMKKQPNIKSYWQKIGSFFHCSTISNLFSHECFFALRRSLHITNPASYVNIERGSPAYDKLRQVWWLVEEIRANCKKIWELGKFLTIDEMMVRYKGTYSPIRQYMPKKPQKWGLKIWCLADAVSKYFYDFSVYCGKIIRRDGEEPVSTTHAGLLHNVVTGLMEGLENKGHVVVMDNYFTSVGLFEELAQKGIYATGTMWANRIGVPPSFKNKNAFNRRDRHNVG